MPKISSIRLSGHDSRRRASRAGNRLRRVLAAVLWGAALWASLCMAQARDFPPQVPPPKPLVLPVPDVRVLPNGLKVMVIERKSLPVVTLHLMIPAGAEDDGEFPGTAQLASTLLTEGTRRRSAFEIAEAVDSIGGLIDTGADWDQSYATLTVLNDHVELAFDLLADLVENAAFAPAETARKMKQTLSALEVVLEDPAYVADTVLQRELFAGTPYSHPADGTLESVRHITPDDLRRFHAEYYTPANAILAVAGDLTAEEAFEKAEKYFGSWQGAAGANPPSRPAPATPSRRIIAVDKPDAVQTEIRLGTIGVPRVSPDYYALSVANQILGGPAANRLFRALRTHQGLTYSASSDLECYQVAGGWVAKTFTRTLETVKSLRIALEQLARLHDQPISDSELESARRYLIGHMALVFETADDVADQTLELMLHNLPLDYWDRFPERIGTLTSNDVWNATRRYADPEHSVIVLVGNVKGFTKELKKLAPVEVIPLDQLDFGSQDLLRPAGKAGK